MGCGKRVHGRTGPRGPGAVVALLRAATVCAGAVAQGGQRAGAPAAPSSTASPATTSQTGAALSVLTTPEPAPPKCPARCMRAVLIARICEVPPLLCPICGGQMLGTAFITHSADTRHILEHIGVPADPPRMAPPLWCDCDAPSGEGVQVQLDWDEAAQPALDFEADQRISR